MVEFHVIADSLAAIVADFDKSEHDRYIESAMLILLDVKASGGDVNEAGCFGVAKAMTEPRAIAKLLSHPGCVGPPREYLLQRLEELLFHEGRHVFLVKDDEEKKDDRRDAGPTGKPPARRFYTIHHAAAWIQTNWPDFDLDRNHPMTWRPGR